MKRTFIDHLNHEIRSPLTVLVGMTELLSLSDLKDDRRQYLATIQQAVQSVLGLMDSAVDFSRLAAGSLALSADSFRLEEALEEAAKPLPTGSAGDCSLEVVLAERIPTFVTGDAERLRQIVESLARYAANVRGIKRLALEVVPRSRNSDHIDLQFTLGPADRRPLPETDEELPAGDYVGCPKDASGGRSGIRLDLAVAAGLTGLMGGRLWLSSSKDASVLCRFTAQFGLPELALRQSDVDRKSGSPQEAACRILLADDTRGNQQLLASLLRDRGHLVVTADNGLQAVELFEAQPPHNPFDLVILDLEMPIMDGWRAAEEMRRIDPQHRVPLVALTAHRIEGAAGLLDIDHFDAALGKPVSAQRLYDLVESHSRPSAEVGIAAQAEESLDPLVDFPGALSRLGGNEQLLEELAEFFLEDCPELLAEAQAAIDRQDAPSLERTAHSIRGLAANFGAQRTVDAAADLEKLGRNAELATADSAYQTLHAEVAKLVNVLEDLVKNSDSGTRASGRA